MKYLFLDIECADGGKGTICSVGYVITDMEFHILKREDIIMNPQGRFYLTGRAGRPDVELAYPMERFKKAPPFPTFYKKIKALVESEEYYVVGHSIGDDVNYLNRACSRYKLEPFTFRYFDTQRMYRELSGEKKSISLENAVLSLAIPETFRSHQSVEDARATMLVLRELLKRENTTFEEFTASTDQCTGSTTGGNAQWDSGPSNREKRRKRELRPEKIPNAMRRGRRNHVLFLRYLEHGEAVGEKSDKLAGKRVSISRNYEFQHFKEMLILAGMIKAAGGEYVVLACNTDIFVTCECTDEDGTPRHCTREDFIDAEIASGRGIEKITLDDLFALLGTSHEALESLPTPDVDYLLDSEKYGR